MNIVLCILIGVVGVFTGFFIGRKGTMDGMFIVDDTNDETTRWILDVKIDPNTIPNKKEIRLKVQKLTEGDV